MSPPRELDEFHDFYKRWSSQIFTFCLLNSGDRGEAEWLTESTFGLYFRCADFVPLHHCSQVPVALLRFASDLADAHCSRRRGEDSCGFAKVLRELPFKDRSAFILVSILRVQPSVAAVALRLRSSQLVASWTRAALRLRWIWLSTSRAAENGIAQYAW
jgi:hypothetical protein